VRPLQLLALLSSLTLFVPGCDPFHTKFADEEEAEMYSARAISIPNVPAELRVMTYNVKFGGGRIDFFFDCHGEQVLMNRSEVIENLQGVAALIKEIDPDVLFLQEVDILSKRSAYVDQVQWLLDNTELNFGAYASQWKADFVPSDGLGAVDSGNAILSKFPIRGAKRIALDLRTDQSSLERYFYLRRNILEADLDVGAGIRLVGTHAEAYSQDGTKEQHVEKFRERMNAAPGAVIGAGDLNTLPPNSDKVKGFDDSVCTDEDYQADDYSEEGDYLVALYDRYESAIPLSEYESDNSAHFSHTTDGNGFWNRKLDYIFTSLPVIAGSGTTHQGPTAGGLDPMRLSDHAPVSVEVQLP
jgi:endonuclease/exonuclease/phosphatase family metal-dependent hydrolase